MPAHVDSTTLRTVALSGENWPDLLALFGANGACGGCWCQWWKATRTRFDAAKGEPNRLAFEHQARSGVPLGLLGYVDAGTGAAAGGGGNGSANTTGAAAPADAPDAADAADDAGKPVGWIACAPRGDYPVAGRSPVARRRAGDEFRLDEVWLITCLFVRGDWRRRGVSSALARAAVAWAGAQGARAVDAVPVEPRAELPDAFAWTGVPDIFAAAGFTEVARPKPTRPVMRRLTSPA